MPTTYIRRSTEMVTEPLERCHDGVGSVDFTCVLAGIEGSVVQFVHDDTLAPGVSIGVHAHEHDEEIYFILDGSGTMTLDGVEHRVTRGDITGVLPGGSHGLLNDSDAPLRVIVVGVSRVTS